MSEYRFECLSCGHKFDEPAYHRERHIDYGFEEVAGCPVCGGGFIEVDRNCLDCIWHDDECMSWDCDYVSRKQIRKLMKEGQMVLKKQGEIELKKEG